VAVGKIRYGDVDRDHAAGVPPHVADHDHATMPADDADPRFNKDVEGCEGVLVYIKPALTGDEPADILNYAGEHRSFPHESTLNQFFTESQFESYRALGYHSVKETLGRVVSELGGDGKPFCNDDFFDKLFDKLYPTPPDFTLGFLAANREYAAIHRALREQPSLARLSSDIYPDLQCSVVPPNVPDPTVVSAERHMVAEMLTVLENVWFGTRLDQYLRHPVLDCWRGVCKRWLSSPIFIQHYKELSSEFSSELRQLVQQMQAELRSEQASVPRDGETCSATERS
jgi:hypothetical protein